MPFRMSFQHLLHVADVRQVFHHAAGWLFTDENTGTSCSDEQQQTEAGRNPQLQGRCHRDTVLFASRTYRRSLKFPNGLALLRPDVAEFMYTNELHGGPHERQPPFRKRNTKSSP